MRGQRRVVGKRSAQKNRILTVFPAIMLAMLIASTNVFMVSPAIPRIVAELGGMEYYSWTIASTLLAESVMIPVVGKLSDLYGRKPFYLVGIAVFVFGSLTAGLAPDFWTLVAARAIQGVGTGTILPLSQAVIGDILAPRERGKYQGLLDVIFGVSSTLGAPIGGLITDRWGWRWLFFAIIPLGVVVFCFIARFLQVPHEKRYHSVDYVGTVSLIVGLTALLLGISFGESSQGNWDSPQARGFLIAGVVCLVTFVMVERRAKEPILPLYLWRNSIFALCNVASAAIGVSFLASLLFIPMFVQGILGSNATNSGATLVPMCVSLACVSVSSGLLISKTGRYKPFAATGTVIVTLGFILLARMNTATTSSAVAVNMIVVGVGLGMIMQTFTLIVQNAVPRKDLGIATATTTLSRSIGRTIGTAALGTVLAQRLPLEIARRLPAGAFTGEGESNAVLNASALVDPATLADLSPSVVTAMREGLAASLQMVFWAVLPVLGLAVLAAVMIREIPLAESIYSPNQS